jgi:hypothetical protein
MELNVNDDRASLLLRSIEIRDLLLIVEVKLFFLKAFVVPIVEFCNVLGDCVDHKIDGDYLEESL